MDLLCFCSVFCLLCLCARLFICCELPVSFSWGGNDVDFCSSGRYSLYVLSVINSNYIGLIFHLFT